MNAEPTLGTAPEADRAVERWRTFRHGTMAEVLKEVSVMPDVPPNEYEMRALMLNVIETVAKLEQRKGDYR